MCSLIMSLQPLFLIAYEILLNDIKSANIKISFNSIELTIPIFVVFLK